MVLIGAALFTFYVKPSIVPNHFMVCAKKAKKLLPWPHFKLKFHGFFFVTSREAQRASGACIAVAALLIL
jgi:hypothetical protein